MSRPLNADLSREWKIHLPATLAGKVEYLLFDPILGKPRYAARARLLTSLLEYWLAREQGLPLPSVPSCDELKVL